MNNNDESKTQNLFDTDEEHETHDNFVNDNDRHRVVNTLTMTTTPLSTYTLKIRMR